jgi:Secretion system C-terminal sorting domain
VVWIFYGELKQAEKRIFMKNINDASPKPQSGRLQTFVLFLLISTLTLLCALSAQSQIVWQSFGSGFANSKGTGSSIISVIGESFVGEASGNGIHLRSGFGVIASTMTSVKVSQEKIPLAYTLSQNYPNPFNPSTVIAFGIPEASHVSLQIFDIIGREVSMLVNEDLIAGNYRSMFIADHLSSGVYFYRIVAARKSDKGRLFIETKKFMLIK